MKTNQITADFHRNKVTKIPRDGENNTFDKVVTEDTDIMKKAMKGLTFEIEDTKQQAVMMQLV